MTASEPSCNIRRGWGTEEAIVNALVAAETMTGRNGLVTPALPHDRLRTILAKYNRLTPK